MDRLSQLSKTDQYLEKIYGEWYNLVAAGTLFITYALFTLLYQFYLKDVVTIPHILERYPGGILVIMGCFFTINAIRLRTKYQVKNNVLLARGIFDILSGIFILILPEIGAMMTMLVMGLVLIHIGVKELTSPTSNVLDFLISVVFIPVGLSDIDVINFFFTYDMRILIFALFLGALGVFLIKISGSYRRNTEGLYK